MEINIKINYDNHNQLIDTSKLSKYLIKCIKITDNEKINVTIEHGILPNNAEYDPFRIIIPTILINDPTIKNRQYLCGKSFI